MSITKRFTVAGLTLLVLVVASVFGGAVPDASAQVSPWVKTVPVKFRYANAATSGVYALKDTTTYIGHTPSTLIDNDTTAYVSLRDQWPSSTLSATAFNQAYLMVQITGGTSAADSFDVIFEPSPNDGENYTASQSTVQTVIPTWGSSNVLSLRLITDADANIAGGSIAGAPGGRFILRQQSNGGVALQVVKAWVAYTGSIAVGNITQ